jgi:hypothetical protein
MEGAAMIRAGGLIDGIEYIGDDEFVVTKERLQELLGNELFVEFYDQGYHYLWCERIPKVYPGYGKTPQEVATAVVSKLIEDDDKDWSVLVR